LIVSTTHFAPSFIQAENHVHVFSSGFGAGPQYTGSGLGLGLGLKARKSFLGSVSCVLRSLLLGKKRIWRSGLRLLRKHRVVRVVCVVRELRVRGVELIWFEVLYALECEDEFDILDSGRVHPDEGCFHKCVKWVRDMGHRCVLDERNRNRNRKGGRRGFYAVCASGRGFG
jgi:hypothetical protein